MKKIVFGFILIFCFSKVAHSEEVRFDCFSETSTFNDLYIDLEKKLIHFDIGSKYIITNVTNSQITAEYHLTKSNKLVFDRYKLTLKYWGSFKGDYHEFKCKLLKRQF